ncbi:hypothetical protein PGN35_021085 [Nodosilinea sp. PGN35]|uniref:hypothetical protein n=1 Tax=Nodosilinea sp. PGN35 TaxID=3020489 RepID=UPI0023B2915E|nr:hypothetical protein [Nodosilinea sp. TSF1-S3]MDF0366854.1 hypothetical protein [Nodosilinea sp. TSF1-S3]
MTTLEQIQQDIETLPQDALNLLAQFIQLLKKSQTASPEHFQAEQLEKGSSVAILQFLHNHPLALEHQRTALEIDQQISEERAAWE